MNPNAFPEVVRHAVMAPPNYNPQPSRFKLGKGAIQLPTLSRPSQS